MGAALVGELIGERQVISLDIGGTTAKCSLISDGKVRTTTEYRLEWTPASPGYPIKAPVVDIVEIGAGGGSIAWIDQGGALRVGPRSAGAVPGPACYGLGGLEPTVTDANLIAGRINPDYFLGGEIRVRVDLAREAMRGVADALDVSVDEAALGVIRIANANMVNALKLVSVRRGYDPREFDMVASGGGGSMHAAALMRELRLKRVIVPNVPGHFSAWGMLMTDMRNDWVQTFVARTDQVDLTQLNAVWDEMECVATEHLLSEGLDMGRVRLARTADMRYVGQEHTVNVPIPAGQLNEDFTEIHAHFHALHEQFYAFRIDASPIELVNLRLAGFGRVSKPEIVARPEQPGDGEEARKGTRRVNFDEDGWHVSAIYERERLSPGTRLSGPSIVEEPAATTVVFPRQHLFVDRYGNLIIAPAEE
jgi:N-methylhydantoinase A